MYIHYGSDQFDRMLCTPARNCSWKPKPEDGTGLWGSRECEIHEDGWVNYGWKEWCEDSHFNIKRLKHFFRFRLTDGAKVIILSSEEDLVPLPKTQPWKPKEDSDITSLRKDGMPSIEQMEEYYRPNPCFLDYERMMQEGIDAIELQHSFLFRRCLDTWDCNCVVVLNPDVIVPI